MYLGAIGEEMILETASREPFLSRCGKKATEKEIAGQKLTKMKTPFTVAIVEEEVGVHVQKDESGPFPEKNRKEAREIWKE